MSDPSTTSSPGVNSPLGRKPWYCHAHASKPRGNFLHVCKEMLVFANLFLQILKSQLSANLLSFCWTTLVRGAFSIVALKRYALKSTYGHGMKGLLPSPPRTLNGYYLSIMSRALLYQIIIVVNVHQTKKFNGG